MIPDLEFYELKQAWTTLPGEIDSPPSFLNCFSVDDIRTLLESAGDENPAAARGFAVTTTLIAQVDERLPRSVLRCAFAGRISAMPRTDPNSLSRWHGRPIRRQQPM
jgi:hypothetical protein